MLDLIEPSHTFESLMLAPDAGGAEARQHLEAALAHPSDERLHIEGVVYHLVAERNGVSLYAAPASVMARPMPLTPLAPTPGVSWLFLNSKGCWVKGFDGSRPGASYQGTFDDFARQVPDFRQANWRTVADRLSA